MKAKIAVVLLMILAVALYAAAGFADEKEKADADKGAEKLTIYGGTRGDIPFPHWEHQEVLADCGVCHAHFSQKKDAIKALKDDGKIKAKKIMNEQCIGCHREKKAAGEKSGPTSCSQCHQRS